MGVDSFMFQAKVDVEQNKLMQKLCWERCADAMVNTNTSTSAVGPDDLPEAGRRCIDRCVHKLADTAMRVSVESQIWQAKAARQQAVQTLATRTGCVLGAVAVAAGVGCYLFKGSDD